MSLSNQEKIMRGWFYVGKTKFYARQCDVCGGDYIGQGKNFCSKECSANVKVLTYDDGTESIVQRDYSTGHNYGEKISASKKGTKAHPNSIKAATEARLGVRLTKEHKEKISQALSGCNHPNWKEDRGSLKKSEKKHLDSQYQNWQMGVKERDGWKCSLEDNSCQGRLEAHHIFDWVNYPELRYQLKNGITLCHAHHPRGRANEKAMRGILVKLVSSKSESF